MAWIESHDNLKDHPKTRRAARLLGVSIPTMVGHLHLLWHWCLTYAEDGDLSGYDHEDIADAMMWEGDADDLVQALVNCGPGKSAGFLEHDQDGRLLVHDWMDYAGKLVEKRRESREAGARGNHERWHVQRGKFDPDCPFCREEAGDSAPDPGEESQGESGGDGGAIRDPNRVLSHQTEPNQTIPNHNGLKETSPQAAPPLDPDSDAYKLAVHLREAILARDATTRVPAMDSSAFRNWVTEARRMLERDKRPVDEAAQLITWAQEHEFWHANILSMTKFRKQYDRLKLQRQQDMTRGSRHARAAPHESAVDRRLRELGVTFRAGA